MKRLILASFLTGLALMVAAAEPVKVIMATTDDGRRVILMPDGKWNFVVAAEEKPKPKPDACQEKLWNEIVGYFTNWDLENINKDSFRLQTKWHRVPIAGVTEHRVKASVLIQADCVIQVDTHYQYFAESSGWTDEPNTGPPGALVKSWGKKLKAFDDQLQADLQQMEDKYKVRGQP